MTIRIKNVVSRMVRRCTSGFKITDDDTTNDDDTNGEYYPANDASGTSDPPPDMNNYNSTDDESISGLDNENSAINLNPAGVNHHGPISGVETNHGNQNDDHTQSEPEL